MAKVHVVPSTFSPGMKESHLTNNKEPLIWDHDAIDAGSI